MATTRFDDVDPVLEPWAALRHLTLYRRYQDDDMRSLELVDDYGCQYQLWLESGADGGWVVRAWDFRARHFTKAAQRQTLTRELESALASILTWIREDGHTWSPV